MDISRESLLVGIFTGSLQHFSKKLAGEKNCQNPFLVILRKNKEIRRPLSSRGRGVRP